MEEAAFEEMAVVVVQYRSQQADSIDSDCIPVPVPAAAASLSRASSVAVAVDSNTDPVYSDLISVHHIVAAAVVMNSDYSVCSAVDTVVVAVVVPNTDLGVDSTDAVHTDSVSVSADFQALIHLASLPTLYQNLINPQTPNGNSRRVTNKRFRDRKSVTRSEI